MPVGQLDIKVVAPSVQQLIFGPTNNYSWKQFCGINPYFSYTTSMRQFSSSIVLSMVGISNSVIGITIITISLTRLYNAVPQIPK